MATDNGDGIGQDRGFENLPWMDRAGGQASHRYRMDADDMVLHVDE